LARRWSDRILEIREAVQSLLLDHMRRLEENGREELKVRWEASLEDLTGESKTSNRNVVHY
jgi:hypothetical protein